MVAEVHIPQIQGAARWGAGQARCGNRSRRPTIRSSNSGRPSFHKQRGRFHPCCANRRRRRRLLSGWPKSQSRCPPNIATMETAARVWTGAARQPDALSSISSGRPPSISTRFAPATPAPTVPPPVAASLTAKPAVPFPWAWRRKVCASAPGFAISAGAGSVCYIHLFRRRSALSPFMLHINTIHPCPRA